MNTCHNDAMTLPLYVFVDESYNADYYYVGMIFAGRAELQRLRDGLDSLVEHANKRFGVAPDTELHGYCIMQGQKPWSCFDGRVHEAVALYKRAGAIIAQSGVGTLIEGVDIARLRARYRYPDSPYEITLRHGLEKINNAARSLSITRGQPVEVEVYADLIDRHSDFVEAIEGYQRTGTPGFRHSRLEHIKQPIHFIDSTQDRGIQAADLLAYIYHRVEHPAANQHPRAARSARAILRSFGEIGSSRLWRP